MEPIYAFAIIMIYIYIGDVIAVKTKGVISMLLTASILFLVSFWLGVPRTLPEDSTLTAFVSMMIPVLLVHIGTTINIKQLIEQWRTLLIALSAVIGVVLGVIGIGHYFVGLAESIIASAPISGGAIAGVIMSDTATEIGRADLALLASLLVAVDGLVGFPFASFALKKEARRVAHQYRNDNYTAVSEKENNEEKSFLQKRLPKKYVNDNYYLMKVALAGALAVAISQLVQSLVGFKLLDQNILALLFGILFHQLGVIEEYPVNKANSNGISMVALTVLIINGLTGATPEVLREILPTIIITLLLGLLGIVLFSFIIGKILKESFWMSMAIGSSALLGFPATFILPNEAASAIAETTEEYDFIIDTIRPKILIAGFVTVSIASIILAGILAPIVIGIAG